MLYAFTHQTQNIHMARRFVDFVRSNYGDTRRNKGPSFVPFDEKLIAAPEEEPGQEIPVSSNNVRPYLRMLPRLHMLIYVLVKKHDVPHVFIADALGVTESRVSQMLKAMQKNINGFVKIDPHMRDENE